MHKQDLFSTDPFEVYFVQFLQQDLKVIYVPEDVRYTVV